MRTLRALLLPFATLTALAEVHAQSPAAPGTRVRISGLSGQSIGVVDRVTADSMVVAGTPIARAEISRIEVSAGRTSHWLKGMGIGVVVGGVAGYGLSALATMNAQFGTCRADEVNVCQLFGVLGAGTGLIVGTVIGGLTHSERWRTLPLDGVRITPVIGPGGTVGIAIGFRF